MKKMIVSLSLVTMLAAGAVAADEFVYPDAPYGSIIGVVGPNPELCFKGGYVYPNDRTTWRCYPMGSNTAANPRFWGLPNDKYLEGFGTPVAVFGADHAWIEIDGQYVPMSRKD